MSSGGNLKLLITALSLFAASFFFPSYDGLLGHTCAWFCMWDIWTGSFDLHIAYYFPFTISNLMMILVPALLMTALKNKRIPMGLIIGQIILLAHVISWPIMHLAEGTLSDVEIGYYGWLLSMLFMLGCTSRKRIHKAG
jgi:hypothetical protein